MSENTRCVIKIVDNFRSSVVNVYNQMKTIQIKIDEHNSDETAHLNILNELDLKSDKNTTYTKTEANVLLTTKANDNNVIHKIGNESASGMKTFTTGIDFYSIGTSGVSVIKNACSLDQWYLININITRENIILYSDINYAQGTPKSEVFQLSSSGTDFVVKLPIPLGIGVDKNDVKFYENNVRLNIFEAERYYNPIANQDILSLDRVFCFKVKATYHPESNYRLAYTEKVIPLTPIAIPFEGLVGNEIFYSKISDNMMLPKLPYPFVYEIWRLKKNASGLAREENKKQFLLKVLQRFKEGYGRYSLFCRGGDSEHTLSEIISRMEGGIGALAGGSNNKCRPFKFAIYNNEAGSRSFLSNTYGWRQTGKSYDVRGFRELKG